MVFIFKMKTELDSMVALEYAYGIEQAIKEELIIYIMRIKEII
jgi:hypothetical protein